jgi:tRNA threonylcarbamoyl adenosine modification protein (Sua5/YciO/YrdC/YwlC family)
VLVPSVAAARELAAFDDRAERLAGRWWPGALTIVLPRRERSRDWDLGGATDTVGIRMPHHPMTLAVLAGTGPLAVTSANRSGNPAATKCEELVETFGDLVAVYLCRDEPFEGTPSTVVDLSGEVPRVLREGTIPLRELEVALSG